ncbi:MAG TPA: hypothetical protein VHI13_15345 [Candidatus Kapabacteria bacterium]|nr:hypothetical protein [Candidatus Kapabacteria bacterium]
MEQQKFYPAMSTLINVDDLPPFLGFLKDQLSTLLDTTFFKNLQHSRSGKGGRAFYSLTLLRYDRIGFTIPGTDIEIDLDSPANSTFTEIPVTLAYQWGIIDLLGSFRLESFTDDAKQLFSMLVRKFDIDPMKVVQQAVDHYAQIPGQLDKFLHDVNTHFGVSIPVPGSGTPQQMLQKAIADLEDELGIPAMEAVYVVYIATVTDLKSAIKRIEQLFSDVFNGRSVTAFLKDLLVPKVDATLKTSIDVKFPRTILVPVDANDDPKPGTIQSTLTVGNVDFYFSTTRGIGFDATFQGSLDRSMIGTTGLIIAFDGVKLDLSTTTNIPEATADGRGPDFVGVFVKSAEISLPKFWKTKPDNQRPADKNKWARILAKNVLIGTGGLSGQFSLLSTTDEPVLETWFGQRDASGSDPGDKGFGIALDRFDIAFHQGTITKSDIQGTLTIPGLKLANGSPGQVRVQVSIDKNGFKISGTFPDVTLGIPNIFNFTFNKLGLGKEGKRFFVEVAGKLDVIAQIPALNQRFIEKPIDIQKLVIWSDGEFDFQGGSIVLPKIAPLKVGPVELSVTALHFGRDRQPFNGAMREYKFIGFDGGVKSGPGGVDARGEGIKFYFTVDNDLFGGTGNSFLRVETIRIDLRIPGDATPETAALLLKGYISMKNPTTVSPGGASQTRALTEYAGGVTFRLPRLEMGGGAELRMIPSLGAFLVDAHLELSTPILLGTTGLGIYGFRGVFGNKYVLDKPADTAWWEFYKKPALGVHPEKFTQKDGFSIGAGVSLATAADSGTTFSSKLFFMLSVPTVFLLEGQAAILSKRIGLDTTDDPPFYAVIAIQPGVGVEAAFGAHMKIPQSSGDVLTLDATLEMAFFFGRASAWYVNIGRDQPESKRVHATILKILQGWSYFMLASSGIKAGAGVEWKFEQDCGIAKVGLGASLEVGGRVSFKPIQLGGWINLQGYAELRVFGIGFRLSVKANLSAEAPHPFVICGSFELSLSTPWPLPDVHINVNLCWHFNDTPNRNEIGMLEPPDDSQFNVGTCPSPDIKLPAKAVHMVTNESFPLNFLKRTYTWYDDPPGGSPDVAIPMPGSSEWAGSFDRFAIPMDSWIDIEFTKGVSPNLDNDDIKKLAPPQTGTVDYEFVPPQKGISAQVKHTYKVERVSLYYCAPTDASWTPLDLLGASTPLLDLVAQTNPGLYASDYNAALAWAKTQIGTNMKYGFWQLSLANTLTKLRLLARTAFEQNPHVKLTELGFPPKVVVCPPTEIALTCLNWTDVQLDTTYPANQTVFDRKLRFTVTGGSASVAANSNPFNISPSLRIGCGNQIELLFPEPVTNVRMKLSTGCEKLVVSYYLGYPYTPKPVELSPSGGAVARWDITHAGGGSNPVTDDVWDRLRNIPSFVRAFCSGASVDTGLDPVVALDTVMAKKFRKTNLYLRQLWGLAAPDPNAAFCARLREMLELEIVALTGRDRVPQSLKVNIDNFYRDAKRYAEQYAQMEHDAGNSLGQPDAGPNAFYEGWLDIIACIGKAYDRRGSLPAAVQALLQQIDFEIGRLYFKVRYRAELRDMHLDQNDPITDPMQQLKMAAEFFAILSLDLDDANIPDVLIEEFDPYYQRLDALAGRLRTALRAAGGTVQCTATGAVPAGDGVHTDLDRSTACNRLQELQAVARLLCGGGSGPLVNTATGPIVEAIGSLVYGFAGTIEALERYFGWPPDQWNDQFCHDLGFALRMVAYAWGVFDELPAALRSQVQEFYGTMQKLVADYQAATENEVLDVPTEETDEFLGSWIDTLACLCRMCGSVESFGLQSERDYFLSTVDPAIDELYDAIAGLTSTDGRSLFGTQMPADDCSLVQTGIAFMTALTMHCGSVDASMQAWLANELAAFQLDYLTPVAAAFRDGAVHPYGSVLCDSGAMNGSCATWIDALECLDMLIARRAYLPQSIIDQIVNDFDDLLLDISNQIFFVYNDLLSWPAFDTRIENTEFEVHYILGHIYGDCLQGNAVNPAILARLTNGQLTDMNDRYGDLRAVLLALPTDQRTGICNTPRSSRSVRQRTLIEIYRKLCNTPPSLQDLSVAPLAEIVFAINHSTDLLNELAAALNLPAPPVGWALTDFTTVLAQVLQLLVIGYGAADTLSLSLESRMNDFYTTLKAATDAYAGGSSSPLAGCQTTCSSFLDMLFCLANVCRYRRYLPSAVFTSDPLSLHVKLNPHLVNLAEKALVWGDLLKLESIPNRSIDRCGKVRVIANYFGGMSLNYDNVSSLEALFGSYDTLRTALAGAGLASARGSLCPVPVDTAYDPLRKRDRIGGGSLGTPVEYNDGSKPIDRIVIAPVGCPGTNCATYIHEICWLSALDLEYNDNLPDDTVVLETNNSVIYGLKTLTQTIWRPNTHYAVQIETRELINDDAGSPYRKVFTFGFRTNGPIGHFHAYDDPTQTNNPQLYCRYKALQDADEEAHFQYANLKQYIDYQRSYPNANGNIIGAKPLYYSNSKLQLFYVVDYIVSMYSLWKGMGSLPDTRTGLQVVIRDPGRPADPQYDIVIDPLWHRDENPHESPDKLTFKYMVANSGGCLQFDPIQVTDKPPAHQTKIPFSLEPRKLYTAMINALMDVGAQTRQTREVHKYVFQTSRYADFAEHIGSYQFDGSNQALYTEHVPDADAAMALAIFTGVRPSGADGIAYDALVAQYADPLDRLVDGALKLGALPAPQTTEFTVIKSGTGGGQKIIGMLIRSPEPFNDPKLPPSEIALGLTATQFPGTPTVIFAKDVSRVFATNATMNVTAGTVAFRFEYRLYDGKQYGPATTMVNVGTAGNPDWQEGQVAPVTVSLTIS